MASERGWVAGPRERALVVRGVCRVGFGDQSQVAPLPLVLEIVAYNGDRHGKPDHSRDDAKRGGELARPGGRANVPVADRTKGDD
eukprot:scaffold49878_cov70-Phaeocystis_antarctica.AAC.2